MKLRSQLEIYLDLVEFDEISERINRKPIQISFAMSFIEHKYKQYEHLMLGNIEGTVIIYKLVLY